MDDVDLRCDHAAAPALNLVRLAPLMASTRGRADVLIGLVDGPVAVGHPGLAGAAIQGVGAGAVCARLDSPACAHGTFIAGILVGDRGAGAAGICPGCSLLARPIFRECHAAGEVPVASSEEVAQGIVDCVDLGARVVNLSAATGRPTTRSEPALRRAIDHAAARGTLVVAAAGNQGALGSSEITRHPGVVPVVAYDLEGRPMDASNLGRSLGRWGLGAPGIGVAGLAADGLPAPQAGTSVAAAVVTGTAALLLSLFPDLDTARLRWALASPAARRSVVPPLLDAHDAFVACAGTGEAMPIQTPAALTMTRRGA
jgi:subtilisin family serine protease